MVHRKDICGTERSEDSAYHSIIGFHEQDERDHHLTLQLDEAVVGNEPREQIRHIPAYLIQVEVFKAFISAQMEQYHDGYYLGVGQPAVPMIPPLRLVPLGGKSVDLDKSVIYF